MLNEGWGLNLKVQRPQRKTRSYRVASDYIFINHPLIVTHTVLCYTDKHIQRRDIHDTGPDANLPRVTPQHQPRAVHKPRPEDGARAYPVSRHPISWGGARQPVCPQCQRSAAGGGAGGRWAAAPPPRFRGDRHPKSRPGRLGGVQAAAGPGAEYPGGRALAAPPG